MTGRLRNNMNDIYSSKLPVDQHGAVSKRGTDFATHTVLCVLAIARASAWSVFTLFVDLVKAFDLVLRQLVVGWGQVPESARQELLSQLGVDSEAAEWIIQYLDERGPLFEQ